MADNVNDGLFSEVPFDNRLDFDGSFQMEITDLEGAGIQALTNADEEQAEGSEECEEALSSCQASATVCQQQKAAVEAENVVLSEALDAILNPPAGPGVSGCWAASGTTKSYYTPENCYIILSGASQACLQKNSITNQLYTLTVTNTFEDFSADCPSPLIGTGLNWSFRFRDVNTGIFSTAFTPPLNGSKTWVLTFSAGVAYEIQAFVSVGAKTLEQELGSFLVPADVTQDLDDAIYIRSVTVDGNGNII